MNLDNTENEEASMESETSPKEEAIVAEKYAHKLIRTLRIRLADEPGKLGEVATVIGKGGALIGDVGKIAIDSHSILRDIRVYVDDTQHLELILKRLGELKGITIEAVTDDVLKLHEGGKLRVRSIPEISTLRDLQEIYTPGVASVSRKIHDEPDSFRRYTWAGNTVAIVTDGSAILGLGDLGPRAALPVMEGKAAILDRLASVNCVPILLSTRDVDEITETVIRIADGFGAVLLEDISAPRCFEIETRLRRALDVPVFHDDQHGTAVVVLAALKNACRATDTALKDLSFVVSGAGAAGAAIARLLVSAGASEIICCDRAGAIHAGRTEHMNPVKVELAAFTNPHGKTGTLPEVLAGASAFIGVSSPRLLDRGMVASMAEPRIVLALANPEPEILPAEALAGGARIALDGRTANNALAFPGIIRGALDAEARSITDAMKVAAAEAIAACASKEMLLPLILDPGVHRAVAQAVADAWRRPA